MVLWFATAATCGIGGAYVAEDVVGALGHAVVHNEYVLRALGWCWGGLPFVLIAVTYFLRDKLATAKSWIAGGLAVWLGSGSFLLPGRYSTRELRFGSAQLDALPLAFGWACGIMPFFASTFLTILVILIVHRLFGRLTVNQMHRLVVSLFTMWCLLTAAGLIAAFVAPLP
jgi:hypothetical protein